MSERGKDFIAYSLVVDESTDMIDTAQPLIFIHDVDSNLRVTEKVLDMKLMCGTATEKNVFETACQSVADVKLP